MGKTLTQAAKRAAPTRLTFVLNRGKDRAQVSKSLKARLVDSAEALRKELKAPKKDAVWISYDKALTQELLKNLARPSVLLGEGVFLHDLEPKSIAALASSFKHFAFSEDKSFLPPEELAEVLQAAHRRDLFIGGIVDASTKTITLWRGDLEPLTVPFTAFPKSGDGIKPDFSRFGVTDYGQTLQLGDYEAAADAVLYEYDPEYRRRIKKERQASEQSFGASLRRLRKQRGLSREDFAPAIAAKTVARIEQGAVKRIQQDTLQAIADRLGVSPEEIDSF
jgi:DNA-binding Xre family transcriptional regulator